MKWFSSRVKCTHFWLNFNRNSVEFLLVSRLRGVFEIDEILNLFSSLEFTTEKLILLTAATNLILCTKYISNKLQLLYQYFILNVINESHSIVRNWWANDFIQICKVTNNTINSFFYISNNYFHHSFHLLINPLQIHMCVIIL